VNGHADGERTVEVDSVRHWCRLAGSRHGTTPLVIAQGGPGDNLYTFERTIGPLLEAFTTLVYYEQRGCGRSAPHADPDAYSMPLLVTDLEALRGALGFERVIPLGFSFGGELAAEYALAYPGRVERLILQAPSIASPLRTATQLMGFELLAEGDLRQQMRAIARGPGTAEERTARVWERVDTATVDRLLFHNADAARLNRHFWRESRLPNSGTECSSGSQRRQCRCSTSCRRSSRRRWSWPGYTTATWGWKHVETSLRLFSTVVICQHW